MPPPYSTAREAVNGLIEAFRTLDIDRIVEDRDFDIDSRLFWQDLGLPITEEQLARSREAFETSFRNQMKEQMPDYRSVAVRIVSEEKLQDNFAILLLEVLRSERQISQLRIPVFLTDNGWKVVLFPGYDQL